MNLLVANFDESTSEKKCLLLSVLMAKQRKQHQEIASTDLPDKSLDELVLSTHWDLIHCLLLFPGFMPLGGKTDHPEFLPNPEEGLAPMAQQDLVDFVTMSAWQHVVVWVRLCQLPVSITCGFGRRGFGRKQKNIIDQLSDNAKKSQLNES